MKSCDFIKHNKNELKIFLKQLLQFGEQNVVHATKTGRPPLNAIWGRKNIFKNSGKIQFLHDLLLVMPNKGEKSAEFRKNTKIGIKKEVNQFALKEKLRLS